MPYTHAIAAWRIRCGAIPLCVLPKAFRALATVRALEAARLICSLRRSCESKKTPSHRRDWPFSIGWMLSPLLEEDTCRGRLPASIEVDKLALIRVYSDSLSCTPR